MKTLTNKLTKGLLTLSIFLSTLTAFSQTSYTGYFCTGVNEFSPIKYTREYKQEGTDKFITVYKISSSRNGYYLNITATHYKSEKKVVVEIYDVTVPNEMGHISTQEVTYDEPSLKIFGRRGSLKASIDAQNVLPNEFAVKFVSGKYENVKVVHIAKDTSMNATKWYVLDERN